MGVFLNRGRWLDSWTYGPWRQWMCRRKDGALQCARVLLPLPFGWALMRAVGPLQYGDWRILPGEESQS